MNKAKMGSIILDTMTRFTPEIPTLDILFGSVSFLLRQFLLINVLLKDTYRAVWGWQILMAPERVPGMVTSMLQDYKEVMTLSLLLRLLH